MAGDPNENCQDKALSSLSSIKIQVVFFWSSITYTIFPSHSETCSSTSPRDRGDSEWRTNAFLFSRAWVLLLHSSFWRTKCANDQTLRADSSLMCSISPLKKKKSEALQPGPKRELYTTIWSCNPTPGHIPGEKHGPKGYMHPSVHSSTVYNSQDMETT